MKFFLILKGFIVMLGIVLFRIINIHSCDYGKVIDKRYVPSKVEVKEYYSITMDAPMHVKRTYPEKFILVLKNDGRTCDCEVLESTYLTYEIGAVIYVGTK